MAYKRVNWENLPSTKTPVNADNLNKMDKGIARTNTQTIDSDANLNDFTENGYYYFAAGHTYTNIPIGVNGWLEVINTGSTSRIKQIWYRDGTLGTNDYQTFVRTCSGGTWSPWRRIITDKITTGSGTANNTYINLVENNHFEKTGNVVSYSFTMVTKGTWGNTTEFISNLPIPVRETRFLGVSGAGKVLRFAISTDGKIKNAYSLDTPTAGVVIEGHLTYIAQQ